MLKVRLVRSRGAKGNTGSTGALARGGRMLGEIEEVFIEGLVAGDTFVFGGEVVRYEALAEDQVYVSRANDADAKVPSYMGGKFPLSTYLTDRAHLQGFRNVRNAVIAPPFPPNTLVFVSGLASPSYLIEIEAIAVLDG